MVVGR
jgi:hypothetical protein